MCNLKTILILISIVPATMVAQNQIPFSSAQTTIHNPDTQNIKQIKIDSLLFQNSNVRFLEFLIDMDLSLDSIKAVTVDKTGRIWIGSHNGLWVFENGQYREFTYKDGLFDKNINQLFCSSEGQIWVATSTGPFALLENHFYVFEPLKNQKILNISENNTDYFFLTENGMSIIEKEKGVFEQFYVQLLSIMLSLIVSGVLLFLGIKHFKTNVEWKANLIRVEQDALLAQMNPHFIFNSLNSVQKYILVNDKESAHDYLQKFASMMRKVLENSNQPMIILSEEIATLELYLQLESLRFDNGFDFEIIVKDKDIWQFEIPPMLLHTFVENAVWHGLMNKDDRGKIILRFLKMNKNFIICEIEDNGIGRKKAAEYKSKGRVKHRSRGIEIVKHRIKLLNLKARQKIVCVTIDLEEQGTHQSGTLVRLEIPVELA